MTTGEKPTSEHRSRYQGGKAVRGAGRERAGLHARRKKICGCCDPAVKAGGYVAHQHPCSRRRILADPDRFCPAEPARW
jgi:hypothetical protein